MADSQTAFEAFMKAKGTFPPGSSICPFRHRLCPAKNSSASWTCPLAAGTECIIFIALQKVLDHYVREDDDGPICILEESEIR